ncbi:MAG: leucine-rich repeat domain-containing protein [Bacteroidales bacterium]|nr:leucine-rich repeat domain-containing protein [Bacteroidales bacterium]
MDINSWAQAYLVDTSVLEKDRVDDDWDNEFGCNYSADGTKLLDTENYHSEMVVREGCKIICDGAFAFEDYMCEEDIPMGEEVPEECRVAFLDKITLPSTLTHIGKEVFRECGALRSIKLPTSLEVIGDSAFENCWSLKSISCPSSLRVIGDYAFGECFELQKVRLNKGLKAICDCAFFYCESLSEVTLPESIEFIGEDAFKGCKSLKKIFIPKGTKDKFASMLSSSTAKKLREI